ncbi:MAG: bifunctional oligoribonuclease/PAP phosphatase NrnA [Thermodesulfovibrionales bacterium]|nr:bifunctional oligoribonuclease/PAP phosphatase NrnA [Thermodesulfovibrionales bacterium]
MREVVEAIKGNGKFFLATHLNPDGDAIGSAVGFGLALKSMGKQVTVYASDGVPAICRFLPGVDMVIDEAKEEDISGSTLILLDCNTLERAGLKGFTFKRSIVIDHHQTESPFGDVRWVEPREPATGSMVFRLLEDLGQEITPDIATNLYSAIAIDTGVFRYANTTADVLEMAALLVRAGADPVEITERLYNSWSPDRYRLFSLAQASLELHGPIAMSIVTLGMFQETGTTGEDTETFVNYPLVMDTVKVSVMLKEKEGDVWKVSLRSKGDIDISRVAVQFNGGGHRNASGCSFEGNIADVKQRLLNSLREIL